ncbi:2,5-dichloro-2,5-cyclohexadiene-1,4-diol dehydrogenase [Zhongshania aliphaticivorans]|uniref:2,5-dichloro-2,5-cyclohexadiene-1,4-diol dehydrogenase n=1 Tax=Zhongshania aliphaticivorans TaxID=1470434 RepID=A0A5S9Q1B6_9GAMM|nr:glucose 1-dehydrogenase [Zhongshania aliphaticivorans]CAA0111263.1 2,5-dichloro-2,5-cyclohexadiene-1,4-diol dehydrogenase [Zhongshania aliphaticivorans]CAA0118539.1 2,5-dichloro-2,5-cyclohexadiene-1,4-diol dehydrogenase [Zhongshania aliphaticivorans]
MIKGKVVIITGAGSGIGKGTALVMAKEGAKLVLADIDREAVEAVCKEVNGIDGDATFIQTDVTDVEQVEAMVDHALKTYGRLDCAFNNAGIEGQLVPLDEIDVADFDRTMSVNLKGVFLCMKYQIKVMEKSGGGSIVNNSSVMGMVASPLISTYCASKHAVIGLTKSAALDYVNKNIRINAVCPGGVETPMVTQVLKETPDALEDVLAAVPAKRLASPEELAEAVIWLCSDRSSFLTGAAVPVDGGYTAQ